MARVLWIDLARTAALVGMVVYHFGYDLALFGVIPFDAVLTGWFRQLAVGVAASFIALAGVSLVLAHQGGIHWPAFLRRFALIAGAAALVTLATYVTLPEAYVYFGILHAIALFSLMGLAFRALPALLLLGLAAGVLSLPMVVSGGVFDMPILSFVGLASERPRTVDYEPVFPWFAPFLAGMALAKIAGRAGWLPRRALVGAQRWLAWPGQHSLAIYLVHQPVLMALIWGYLQLA